MSTKISWRGNSRSALICRLFGVELLEKVSKHLYKPLCKIWVESDLIWMEITFLEFGSGRRFCKPGQAGFQNPASPAFQTWLGWPYNPVRQAFLAAQQTRPCRLCIPARPVLLLGRGVSSRFFLPWHAFLFFASALFRYNLWVFFSSSGHRLTCVWI